VLGDGAVISWEEAVELVGTTSKYGHALLVVDMMESLAGRLREDEQEWRLVGLLHDLDYDEVRGNMSKHGVVAAERLKGKLPKHCLYAIKAHDYRTGFKPKNKLDKALIAADTVAIVVKRSGKKVEQFDVATFREEIERTCVSQPWLRDNVSLCDDLGLGVNEILRLCLC
jgi:putative nucleotidyltransferase with HDIG domain